MKNKEDPLKMVASGMKKIELKDFKGAVEDCNKAIELDPNDEYAYYWRGVAKSQLGDDKGAREDADYCHKLIHKNYKKNEK